MEQMMRRLSKFVCLACVVVSFAWPVAAQSETPTPSDPIPTVSKIAYTTWDEAAETYVLNVVNADGSNPLPLVIGRVLWAPAWSPDGRTLAFVGRASTGGRQYIYMIGADGSDLRVLPLPPPLSTIPEFVAWSPDGTQIIYGASASGPIRFIKYNLEDGESEWLRFPDIASGFIESWVAWSPDGSQIAVHAHTPDNRFGQLYIADADSQNAAPFIALTPNGTPYSHATWSPDGTRMVLDVHVGLAITQLEGIAVANPDGSGLQTIVTPPPNYIQSLSWSPDGSQIAFVATELGVPTMPEGELFVVNADGSNLRALNIPGSVMSGTSWGLVPADLTMPSEPVLLENAAKPER
jgi:Tol biopolymer transport system component